MIEICIHAREGQGDSLTGYVVAYAALIDGKFVQMRPTWGDRGTGKPIKTVLRISETKIRNYSESYNFDIVGILDETLLRLINPNSNAKEDSIKILNSRNAMDGFLSVDLSGIAKELGGKTAVAMAGAICASKRLTSLQSLIKAVERTFDGDEDQILTAKRGYEAMQNANR
jgi:2-oxoacid:acceptor oxidoreductase gamma subunit (pyruvate/2-ketoisovalerate family)